MQRKLFVSDLDGTLLKIGNKPSAGISAANREAVLRFVEKGHIFAVATARNDIERVQFRQQMGFEPDFIGGNGTVLRFKGHEEQHFIDPINMERVRTYLRVHNIPATMMTHTEEHHYIEKTNYYPFIPCGGPRDLEERFLSMEDLPEDLSSLRTLQFMTFIAPRDLERVRTQLQSAFSDSMEICSSDVDVLSFTAKDCTKGKGVLKLAEKYGIAHENIAVIGDSENDISMISAVQHGYCMDHAEEIVQACAKKSVSSVAEALRDFLGEEE